MLASNGLQNKEPPGERSRDTLIAAIIGAAMFVQTLDATIVVNALPTMAVSLHQSPLTLNMAITAYMIAAAMFLPVGTWIADRFGARKVFRGAILAFALASALCGLSHSLWQLVAARMLQGAAGAMMQPVGRLILLKSVPKERLMGALAILSIPQLLGPVIGQPIGGMIVTFASWRYVFFINLPLAVIGVILITLFIPDIREDDELFRLDWTGLFLSACALSGLMFGFENIGRGFLPWPYVVGLLVTGVGSGWLLFRHASRVEGPIVDVSLLKLPTFRTAMFVGVLTRLQLGALPFMLALLLQVAFGMSAFAAGLITFASSVGAIFMKSVAPPIIRYFGFRTTLLGNTLCAATLMISYSLFRAGTPHWLIFTLLMIGGFFRALQFTSLNGLAYADVPSNRMSRASSLSAMFQQGSLAAGVGFAALILHTSALAAGRSRVTVFDISTGFVIIGLITISATALLLRLPANAGAEMSGHKGHRRSAMTEPQVEEEAA
jgi:EmrB/QacA subfamily drug resistance transporter